MKKQKQNPKQVDSQLSKFVCRVKSAQNFNLLRLWANTRL